MPNMPQRQYAERDFVFADFRAGQLDHIDDSDYPAGGASVLKDFTVDTKLGSIERRPGSTRVQGLNVGTTKGIFQYNTYSPAEIGEWIVISKSDGERRRFKKAGSLWKSSTVLSTLGDYPASGIKNAVFEGSGLDDMTSGGSSYSGTTESTFDIEIDGTGTPDTFKWRKDGGSYAEGVAIANSSQMLSDGVTIRFRAEAGHSQGDIWHIRVAKRTLTESNYWIHNNNLRDACGVDISDTPMWLGYIKRSYFDGIQSIDEWHYDKCDIEGPTSKKGDAVSVDNFTTRTSTADNKLNAGFYMYQFTLVYDGFQESPPVQIGPETEITGEMNISFDIHIGNWDNHTFRKRITYLKVYQSREDDSAPDEDRTYRLICIVDFSLDNIRDTIAFADSTTNEKVHPFASSVWTETGNSNSPYNIRYNDESDDTKAINTVAIERGTVDTSTNIKYQSFAQADDRVFIGNVRIDGEHRPGKIYYSSIDGNGNHCPDVYILDNEIDLSIYDDEDSTGIAWYLGRLYIFTPRNIYKLDIGDGNEATWRMDESWAGVGAVSDSSVTVTPLGIIYMSIDGLRIFNGEQSQLISRAIEESISSEDFTDARVGWSSKHREVWLSFPANGKVFALSLDSESRAWREVVLDSLKVEYFTDNKSGEFFTSGTAP